MRGRVEGRKGGRGRRGGAGWEEGHEGSTPPPHTPWLSARSSPPVAVSWNPSASVCAPEAPSCGPPYGGGGGGAGGSGGQGEGGRG